MKNIPTQVSDSRFRELDQIKGVAVICMIIFHSTYYPHICGFHEFQYDTLFMNVFAKVAQVIFLFSVGINLQLANEKNKQKQMKQMSVLSKTSVDVNQYLISQRQKTRIIKLTFFAMIISVWTYLVFDTDFVKFGILHFIATASLILLYIDNPIKIIVSSLIIYFMYNRKPLLFHRLFPSYIGFVMGVNNNYSAIDHFSLIPWINLPSTGMLFAKYLLPSLPLYNREICSNIDLFPDENCKNILSEYLQLIGKKSLEIYMIHWIVLYIVFNILY